MAPTLLQIRLSPLAPNLLSSCGICKPGVGKHSLCAGIPLHQPDPAAAPSSFPPKNSPPHVIPSKSQGNSQTCCHSLSLRLQKVPCPSPSSLPAIATKMSQPGLCTREHPQPLRCGAGGSEGAQVGSPLGPADFGTWVLRQQLRKLCRRFSRALKGEFTAEVESLDNAELGRGDGKPSASQLFR